MDAQPTGFVAHKRRPRPAVIALVIIVHVVLFYVLLRSLAPNVTGSVEKTVLSAFTVTVTAPPPPPEPKDPEPEGASGDPGKKAVPKPVTAPTPKIPVKTDKPAPRASSTGAADTSGATDAGAGTGRSGGGEGTGSGDGGGGTGGGGASKPVLLTSITDVRAFPIPPGGREARIGKSVIVKLTVSPTGRVTSCSVYRPSPFPDTDAVVCRLAYDQLRFTPAKDRSGNPVSATFYYQQRFFS